MNGGGWRPLAGRARSAEVFCVFRPFRSGQLVFEFPHCTESIEDGGAWSNIKRELFFEAVREYQGQKRIDANSYKGCLVAQLALIDSALL